MYNKQRIADTLLILASNNASVVMSGSAALVLKDIIPYANDLDMFTFDNFSFWKVVELFKLKIIENTDITTKSSLYAHIETKDTDIEISFNDETSTDPIGLFLEQFAKPERPYVTSLEETIKFYEEVIKTTRKDPTKFENRIQLIKDHLK
jgi:hypothetical protein